MNLANILNGTEKVGKHSSITFNGQVYRGEKAIKELARKTVGNSQEVVTNDRPKAATKPRTRNTRSRATSSKPANDNSAGSSESTPGSDGGGTSE